MPNWLHHKLMAQWFLALSSHYNFYKECDRPKDNILGLQLRMITAVRNPVEGNRLVMQMYDNNKQKQISYDAISMCCQCVTQCDIELSCIAWISCRDSKHLNIKLSLLHTYNTTHESFDPKPPHERFPFCRFRALLVHYIRNNGEQISWMKHTLTVILEWLSITCESRRCSESDLLRPLWTVCHPNICYTPRMWSNSDGKACLSREECGRGLAFRIHNTSQECPNNQIFHINSQTNSRQF